MELILYEQEEGQRPFQNWLMDLKDEIARSRILARMRQVQAGNMGDCAPVGDGMLELRIHLGAGYRLYCGRSGTHLVILLCGGDKASQPEDIQRAKRFWADWKRRQK